MSTTYGQCHYRCSFDVKPAKTDVKHNPWSQLIKEIRAWIGKHNQTDDEYGSAWFYNGGTWKSHCPNNIRIKTKKFMGNGGVDNPEFWAISYTHNCHDYPNVRFWNTEIGIMSMGDIFRFNLNLQHSLNYGYIGEEPHAPNPTTPGIVSTLLKSKWWDCYIGDEKLSLYPNTIRIGAGKLLEDLLTSENRHNPIILVSRETASEQVMIDSKQLAKRVAGIASVYEFATVDVQDELEWILGKCNCKNGMVRVYQEKVDLDNSKDYLKHRFFRKDKIVEFGQDNVIEMIVQGLQRRHSYLRHRGIFSIDDIFRVERERRLLQLRESQDSASADKEILELIEKENEELREENKYLYDTLQNYETKFGELNDRISELEYLNKEKSQRNKNLEAERTSVEQIMNCLKVLPATHSQVVDTLLNIFPDKIFFTEKGIKSLSTCTLKGNEVLWNHLWAMSTVLHDLLFLPQNEGINVENQFKSETGLDISLREGKLTNKGKKYQKARRDIYMGKEIDITPHLKYGRQSPDLLRIYFYKCNDTQKIVIGQCGEHLENPSS